MSTRAVLRHLTHNNGNYAAPKGAILVGRARHEHFHIGTIQRKTHPTTAAATATATTTTVTTREHALPSVSPLLLQN